MFQTDVPTATSSLPAPSAAGTPGFFAAGTVVDNDFLNMIMMELIGVVAAAGLAPSKTDHTQLLQALTKGFGLTKSFNIPGYMALPGGLIVQWGRISDTAGTGVMPVTFPEPFPGACLVSFATNAASSGVPAAFHSTGSESATGMTIRSATAAGTAPTTPGTTATWLALGH